MTQVEKIEQIITKMEKLNNLWWDAEENKNQAALEEHNSLEQEIRSEMVEIGIDFDTVGAEYEDMISKLKGYKEEEEKKMSEETQMGYANIINEIADTIGQAEQINERMWREEAITHDRKRYFITYEFTDEEITEAKACDDPAQFEEFLPYDERHVYEVEEI